MLTTLGPFRYQLAVDIFNSRLRREGVEDWEQLAEVVVQDVCGGLLSKSEISELTRMIAQMEFIPGGRYLAYAGRPVKYFQNCYALISEEDTREDWAELYHKAGSCLMTGGGIGNDYTIYRPKGERLGRTGGTASGPLPAMSAVNEIGRASIQGGGRRAAIYASLAREHGDVFDFLRMKNWHDMRIPGMDMSFAEAKQKDFDFPCPMDHTNISVNYGDEWLELAERSLDPVFEQNCLQAMQTGEPGFSFNFNGQSRFTGRNACTEFITDSDSDACNLGSVNFSRIETLDRFREVCELGAKFLYCGTLRSEVPYDKVGHTRNGNRRIGLGVMGVHEWLLKRGYRYEVTPELHEWLDEYRSSSVRGADAAANHLGLNKPKAYRAIAPTGTIGIYAGTTTGIEPVFAVAFKRRYRNGMQHRFQYVIDPTARAVVEQCGVDPDSIETALSLAQTFEQRIKFQADIQDYVDMGISSTVNLPAWGSEHNNADKVGAFTRTLAKYAPRLRGITFYPDGARGGQPLESVSYSEAQEREGQDYVEEAVDVCQLSGKGSCAS